MTNMKTLDRRERIVSSLLTDEMDRFHSKENTYDCTKYVDVGLICKKTENRESYASIIVFAFHDVFSVFIQQAGIYVS